MIVNNLRKSIGNKEILSSISISLNGKVLNKSLRR